MTADLQDGLHPAAEVGRIDESYPREAVVVPPETYETVSGPDAEPLTRAHAVLAAQAARRRRPPSTATVTGLDG